MKISRIRVYQVQLPLREGRYAWSEGKSVDVFDSTVVAIETDDGLAGYGEVCPLGPVYLPAFAGGVVPAINEIAPSLMGCDPRQTGVINQVMDSTLKGHPYAKSALDMACWDLLGKATGLPCSTLLGGRFGAKVALYRAISQDSPEAMAANVAGYRDEGYTKFQLKAGGDPDTDINRILAVREQLTEGEVLVADANTGWSRHAAMRVVQAVRDVDVYIEQPCPSYEDCLSVRNHCQRPFILDETITDLPILARAHADHAMDAVNIKISKFGGLTKAARARDFCVQMGTAMTIEDSWGGDIITSAIAHLSHSTPEPYRFSATDFNSYGTVTIADGAPTREAGHMASSSKPGLGIEPRMDVLGPPVKELTVRA